MPGWFFIRQFTPSTEYLLLLPKSFSRVQSDALALK
jgi:hypothetical protein